MWDKLHTRNPMLLLRFVVRALSGLLIQEPPRNTRRHVSGSPAGNTSGRSMPTRCIANCV